MSLHQHSEHRATMPRARQAAAAPADGADAFEAFANLTASEQCAMVQTKVAEAQFWESPPHATEMVAQLLRVMQGAEDAALLRTASRALLALALAHSPHLEAFVPGNKEAPIPHDANGPQLLQVIATALSRCIPPPSAAASSDSAHKRELRVLRWSAGALLHVLCRLVKDSQAALNALIEPEQAVLPQRVGDVLLAWASVTEEPQQQQEEGVGRRNRPRINSDAGGEHDDVEDPIDQGIDMLSELWQRLCSVVRRAKGTRGAKFAAAGQRWSSDGIVRPLCALSTSKDSGTYAMRVLMLILASQKTPSEGDEENDNEEEEDEDEEEEKEKAEEEAEAEAASSAEATAPPAENAPAPDLNATILPLLVTGVVSALVREDPSQLGNDEYVSLASSIARLGGRTGAGSIALLDSGDGLAAALQAWLHSQRPETACNTAELVSDVMNASAACAWRLLNATRPDGSPVGLAREIAGIIAAPYSGQLRRSERLKAEQNADASEAPGSMGQQRKRGAKATQATTAEGGDAPAVRGALFGPKGDGFGDLWVWDAHMHLIAGLAEALQASEEQRKSATDTAAADTAATGSTSPVDANEADAVAALCSAGVAGSLLVSLDGADPPRGGMSRPPTLQMRHALTALHLLLRSPCASADALAAAVQSMRAAAAAMTASLKDAAVDSSFDSLAAQNAAVFAILYDSASRTDIFAHHEQASGPFGRCGMFVGEGRAHDPALLYSLCLQVAADYAAAAGVELPAAPEPPTKPPPAPPRSRSGPGVNATSSSRGKPSARAAVEAEDEESLPSQIVDPSVVLQPPTAGWGQLDSVAFSQAF